VHWNTGGIAVVWVQVEPGPQWVLQVPQCWAVLSATHMPPHEIVPVMHGWHTPETQLPPPQS
jgi:hypothetical protein